MTLAQAHLLCGALVAIDLLARAWRIQWMLRGLDQRISLRDAFALNAYGDAACALTPLRIGGEPARLAGMLQSRVPATAAFVAIGVEVLAAWPVIIVCAGMLAWWYAPAWWTTMGPHLLAAAQGAWPWIAGVTLLSVAVWVAIRRRVSPATHLIRRPALRALVYWRRMPHWPLVASIPMSFLNLVTRVAILPVLALTLPQAPEPGPMALGSFALLYSQLVLPTPSGAGPVELAFLGGAAGELGDQRALLLLLWRFYTNGVGVLIGVWLAARSFGWPALRAAALRLLRRPAATVPAR